MSKPKLNILVAYPYWRNNMAPLFKLHSDKMRLLIDSGAFTAWKSGKTIDKKDYAEFIEQLPIKPWRYFSLDVIGDAKRTQNNLDWYHANGFTPTPIFQRGEDFKLLSKYAEYTGIVGIGLGVHSKGSMNYLRETMKHANGVNVHWLGIIRPQWITYYKPYSTDSTFIWRCRRIGILDLYDKGKFTSIHNPISKRNKHGYIKPTKKITNLIRRYGGNPSLLQHEETWRSNNGLANILQIRSWITYCREVERRFKTKIFLGCVDVNSINELIKQWEWCEQNGY